MPAFHVLLGAGDEPNRKDKERYHKENNNSNAVQELLAGLSTSMFVNSYGIALATIEGGQTYVAAWVAVIAALVLAISTVRFWLLRNDWPDNHDWQSYAYLGLAVALLAAEIAAMVEVTTFYSRSAA